MAPPIPSQPVDQLPDIGNLHVSHDPINRTRQSGRDTLTAPIDVFFLTERAVACAPVILGQPGPPWAVCRRVSGRSATPSAGPAVQPAGKWTVSTEPAKITTTDFGTLVEDTGLGSNNNVWVSLGNGTYTPLCLSWLVTAGNKDTLYYIKVSLHTHDWSKISAAEVSTC
jgi:hypothetical protein